MLLPPPPFQLIVGDLGLGSRSLTACCVGSGKILATSVFRCLQIGWGSYQFTTAQLKLVVFSIFSVTYLDDQDYLIAFGFIVDAVFFMFYE
jgi:hypothetical protein